MNSNRRKREAEIGRIMGEAGPDHDTDFAFREAVRRAGVAIIEEDVIRMERGGRARQRKRPISPVTVGLCLLAVGTAASLLAPTMGAVLLFCGIAAIVWATVLNPSKKTGPVPRKAPRIKSSFHT
jgi:hypothetical protein